MDTRDYPSAYEQEQKVRIPDPTVRTTLPTSLLRAVGQGHVQLYQECRRLIDILDQVGWPARDDGLTSDREWFALEPESELRTALDHARYTVQLTWVICGLVSTLGETLGAALPDAYSLDETQLKLRGQAPKGRTD